MFLRCHTRQKDGKLHRYWSIVESRRCGPRGTVQRPVLYLGEINDSYAASGITVALPRAAHCRVPGLDALGGGVR